MFGVLPRGVLPGTVAEFHKEKNVRLRIALGRPAQSGLCRRPFEGVAGVAAHLCGGQAVEVIEQDVIAGIGFVLGVAVHDLSAAKTSSSVVHFAVDPVENCAVIVSHHAFVGFPDERLFGFRGKIAAGASGVLVRSVNSAQRHERVIQQWFRLCKLAAAHRHNRGAVFPEHPVAFRSVFDGGFAIHDRIARALPTRNGLGRRAPDQKDSDQKRRRRRFHRRCSATDRRRLNDTLRLPGPVF